MEDKVAGLVLLGFGVWIRVHSDAIMQILGSSAGHMLNVSYFCIIGGCFLTLLGFFGCCGTIKESKVLLLMFHCCGLNNYTDFEGSYYQIEKGRRYPKSCCRNPFSADCDGLSTSDDVIYTEVWRGSFLMECRAIPDQTSLQEFT
ncbi:tetraspanin-16-like [Mobula birostris]|uniref:tetraspanin-16-like n=1 Tax=Mobula birostris TaxID=1983395 RepID=UPI003B27F889